MRAASLCLGVAGAAAPAAATEFRLVSLPGGVSCDAAPCRRGAVAIQIEGMFDLGIDARFAAFMQAHAGLIGGPPIVLLHSPGGIRAAGVLLGVALRRAGATAIVAFAPAPGRDWAAAARVEDPAAARFIGRGRLSGRLAGLAAGTCHSACVWVLAGGVRRIVPPGSVVGVHRGTIDSTWFRPNEGSFEVGSEDHVMRRYLQLMGVDPALMTLARATPNATIRILQPAELRRLRVER